METTVAVAGQIRTNDRILFRDRWVNVVNYSHNKSTDIVEVTLKTDDVYPVFTEFAFGGQENITFLLS